MARSETETRAGDVGTPRGAWPARRTAYGPLRALALLWLGIGRVYRARGLVALLAVCMLLTSVLACTIPLYTLFIEGAQLQQALLTSEAQARNVDVRATSQAATVVTGHAALDAAVRRVAARNLPGFTAPQPMYYVMSGDTVLVHAGPATAGPLPGTQRLADLEAADLAQLAPYMRLEEGRLPAPTTDGVPEVLITTEMAQREHLMLGDTVTMVGQGGATGRLTGRVVGIWWPKDERDPFWNGWSFEAVLARGFPPPPPHYPILMRYDDLFRSLAAFPSLSIAQHWVYHTEPQRITSATLGDVTASVQVFREQIAQATGGLPFVVAVGSKLDQLIAANQAQNSFFALPLYLVALPTLGLALLFIVALAALVMRAQAQDIATLRSRGLGGGQLLVMLACCGVPPALLAAFAAPPLAGAISAALVRAFQPATTYAQSGVTPAYLASLARPGAITLVAGAAALLGLAALVGAGGQAAQHDQRDILAFRREAGRPARPPFWQRYYLDVALALLSVLSFFELGQFGGTAARIELGGATSVVLLLAPCLLLLAGALLLLRALPVVAGLGYRLAARARGLVGAMTFAAIARGSAHYARGVLFIALALGLGLFAVNYDAALDQNIHDTAIYHVGADLRLTLLSTTAAGDGRSAGATLARVAGISAMTPAFRIAATANVGDADQSLSLLGIDPATFGAAAGESWRADYADQPLDTLLRRLAAPTSGDAIPALVDEHFAGAKGLALGDIFTMTIPDANDAQAHFTVVGIVRDFPTLYPSGSMLGFVVANLTGVDAAISATNPGHPIGLNEYWLKVPGGARQSVLAAVAAQAGALGLSQTFDAAREEQTAQASVLNGGMRGILLVGAAIAAVLALLEIVAEAALATRRRTPQFALLRTLGMRRDELRRLLLGEHLAVYALGGLGGTALGLLLTTATLPFLQFSASTLDFSTIGVPPYRLVLNLPGSLALYAALILALAAAIAVSLRVARRSGLARALRLGED